MPPRQVRDGEVEADHGVHRKDERRRETGEQKIGGLVSIPMLRRAAPAERQHSVSLAGEETVRAIAQRRQIGNESGVPKEK